jgi:hypothetical protein
VNKVTLYLLNPTDSNAIKQIVWTESKQDALQAVSFSLQHAKLIKSGQRVIIPLARNYDCQLLTDQKDYQLLKQTEKIIRIRFEDKEFHLYHRLARKVSH